MHLQAPCSDLFITIATKEKRNAISHCHYAIVPLSLWIHHHYNRNTNKCSFSWWHVDQNMRKTEKLIKYRTGMEQTSHIANSSKQIDKRVESTELTPYFWSLTQNICHHCSFNLWLLDWTMWKADSANNLQNSKLARKTSFKRLKMIILIKHYFKKMTKSLKNLDNHVQNIWDWAKFSEKIPSPWLQSCLRPHHWPFSEEMLSSSFVDGGGGSSGHSFA